MIRGHGTVLGASVHGGWEPAPMGTIVNGTYMTLDGDITNMHDWHMEYVGAQAEQASHDQLFGSDALLMGRATYDAWSEFWPTGADDFADRMNALPKYVVSSTLRDPGWHNTTVIGADVVEGVRRVRERHDRVLQYGFGSLARLLVEHGLLDELRLWLHPVMSGRAKPGELLYRDAALTTFTLEGTEVHDNGLVILSYRPTTARG